MYYGISKIAESFICKFLKMHLSNLIDLNHFRCAGNRSTIHALVELADVIFRSSDNSSNITPMLFVDFSKGFDFVDHNMLLEKFLLNIVQTHI